MNWTFRATPPGLLPKEATSEGTVVESCNKK